MLRNLIRRNDATLQDDIRFLLDIPAVKALVHTAVTANQPNELIRLALTTGNQNAAALLLTIPDVRTLAEQNNFYRTEAHANRFGGETDLDGLLKLPTPTDISSQSILKAKTRLNPHGELGPAIITEIQCLQRGCSSQSSTVWVGSKEKLAAILAAVNTLTEVSSESLTQHLLNEQSSLSQALFMSLATPANGNQNPDETQMQAIKTITPAQDPTYCHCV